MPKVVAKLNCVVPCHVKWLAKINLRMSAAWTHPRTVAFKKANKGSRCSLTHQWTTTIWKAFFLLSDNDRRKLWGLSLKQWHCYASTVSACEEPWGNTKEGLPHFNKQRPCQWQLLWLFWNSMRDVSGARIDSKCDSSCLCGISVLMIGRWLSRVSPQTLWASYQVAGHCWSELILPLHEINSWWGLYSCHSLLQGDSIHLSLISMCLL